MTDGLAEAGEPVFDHGGKYLYFLASTDAGPVNNWFDQSFTDMQATSIGLPGHARQGDGQPAPEGERRGRGRGAETARSPDSKSEGFQRQEERSKDKEKGEQGRQGEAGRSSIDLDGIAGRVVALPIEAGHLQDLAAGADGQIYYIRRVEVRPGQGPAGAGSRR